MGNKGKRPNTSGELSSTDDWMTRIVQTRIKRVIQ